MPETDTQVWRNEGADLIDALLECKSAEEAHDLLVNYALEFADLAGRLREI